MNRKDGGGEGGQWGGRDGGGRGTMGRGERGKRWGSGGRGWGGGDGNGEREMGRWATGRGRLGGDNREGEMRKGDFTDGYKEILGWTYGMLGWNEVTEFSDFVHPCNAGYPS